MLFRSPVVGVTTAELTARFSEAGVAQVDATDTIDTLAKANETDPMKLLSAAMTPRSDDTD